jgi:hypothetical protein
MTNSGPAPGEAAVLRYPVVVIPGEHRITDAMRGKGTQVLPYARNVRLRAFPTTLSISRVQPWLTPKPFSISKTADTGIAGLFQQVIAQRTCHAMLYFVVCTQQRRIQHFRCPQFIGGARGDCDFTDETN